MDLGKGSHISTDISSSLQRGTSLSVLAASQSTEYDEIPLDSSSEEPQSSSDASESDSGSGDEDETECSPLISIGHEYIAIQPHLPKDHVSQQHQGLGRKRKSLGAADTRPNTVSAKKVKLNEKGTAFPLDDKSILPAEIWHRIFTFTTPKSLGSLLCVNKLFNAYLDPLSRYRHKYSPSVSQTSTSPLKPDAIWRFSRRRFWPRMPAPLVQKTELDMWRLVGGKSCQFCGKVDSMQMKSPCNPMHAKSRHIWAFALRSCGSCLVEKTVKEIDLLLSSVPSVLIPALPFVLITGEMHTISPDALQKGLIPPDSQITKIYLSEHVENLKQEFLSVKSMGGATVEEWLKGLDLRGKELLSDSMRWEKWVSTGGITQLSLNDVPNENISSDDDYTSQVTSLQHITHSNVPRVRTREEAAELKATRRAEIERRAMELDPPLTPNILELIPSFQAAIQIISPLDDNAWRLLKSRLLSQRVDAEMNIKQNEPDKLTSTTLPQLDAEGMNERSHKKESNITTKQLIDKTWDDAQAPLRARISAYADEVIQDGWGNGRKVDVENSPHFAAEVLLYVRKRFYAEIAKELTATRAVGQQPVQDPADGPFTQTLTLENMRWLFDVKIKPHTESYRKDLFFCNGCEVNLKAFGFEGVIQHYAAKHTNVLSLGSVVVHWRAEWPDIPPFRPNPQDIKVAGPPTGLLHDTSRSQNDSAHRHELNPYLPSSHVASSFTIPPPSHGYPGHGPLIQHPNPYDPNNVYAFNQDHNSPYPLYPSPYDTFTLYGVAYPGPPQHFPPGFYPTPPDYAQSADVYTSHNYNAHYANSQPGYQNSYGSSLPSKYHTQLEYLVRSSRELWTATAGLKELPGSIRVQVVIHHVVQKFRSTFSEIPPLTMFIDGLSNNKEMRPVRNINGLACKVCYLGLGPGIAINQDGRTFSLPQLVNHFQQKHVDQLQGMGAPVFDWTTQMVHTPDLSALPNLRQLANMDNQKFSLISDAFPPVQYSTSTGSQRDVSTNTGVAPYFRHHSAYNPSIQEPPQDDTSRKPVISHDSDMHQSAAMGDPPPVIHEKFQQGESNRSSSESQIGHDENKQKRQRGNFYKDGRNTRQGFKNRKGKNTRGVTITKLKLQEPDGEELVTEEERQQQEEIRAMWAADRAEAARIVSRSQRPVELDEPNKYKARKETKIQTIQAPKPPSYSNEVQGRQQTDAIWTHEEDDLIAGLESQLDQQRVLSEHFHYQPKHALEASHEQQSHYKYSYPSQGRPYEVVDVGSPVYPRHEVGPHLEQNRDRSSGYNQMDPIYESKRAIISPDDVLRDRIRRDRPTYTDNLPTRQNAPQYDETYELIRVRDSQGEYFIKQPIRLERELRYIVSENGRSTYRGTDHPHGLYRHDEHSMIQPGHEHSIKSDDAIGNRSYGQFPVEGSAAYEDYDPRFPAAPPDSNLNRQVQYR